ncbi:MAG TPA: hypothetical protein VIG24_05255 [Acidimicrobiia bacterium]
MTAITPPESSFNDVTLLKLAREIAMDIRPIDEIIEKHGVSEAQWRIISMLPRFQDYLGRFVEEWNSAVNTAERVKLKSMAFVEESLPEFYARAHDPEENLNAKVEVLKAVARFAGVGGSVDGSISGERLSVTINLGSDNQLKIEKNINPTTIEGDRL